LIGLFPRSCWLAAGGWSPPYPRQFRRRPLPTDGGQTRNRDRNPPAPRRIRFSTTATVAIGDSSICFPGVFVTDSGGRSWRPITGKHRMAAADFLIRLARVAGRRRGHDPPRDPAHPDPCSLRPARSSRRPRRWPVGDATAFEPRRGAICRARPAAPEDHTVRLRGPGGRGRRSGGCLWLRLLTADGRTWTAPATGQQVPLYGLCFVDDQHGWRSEPGHDPGQRRRRSDTSRFGGTWAALLASSAARTTCPRALGGCRATRLPGGGRGAGRDLATLTAGQATPTTGSTRRSPAGRPAGGGHLAISGKRAWALAPGRSSAIGTG
jgi:hypothetical protein